MKRIAKWVGVGIVVFIAWTAFALESAVDIPDTLDGLSSNPSVSVEPRDISPQEKALAGVLRSQDTDRVWVGFEDWEIAELAGGFCRIADLVADRFELQSSGVDQSNRGQYFIGAIMEPDAPPRTLIRSGALLGALVSYEPTLCSASAVGVLMDAMDWTLENFG